MDIGEILQAHKAWLSGKPGGIRADLRGADLYKVNMSSVDLRKADLRSAVLRKADLSRANLSGADLGGADLSRADLSYAFLVGANLKNADLCLAKMYCADLRESDLSEAQLYSADMRRADLSGATGLICASDYIKANFESTADGYIAYKTFGYEYDPPEKWRIEPGSVLEESVNQNRADRCGCGINVATLEWVRRESHGAIWKVLIRWEWLAGVVVPYDTNGKIRCERVELLEMLEENE